MVISLSEVPISVWEWRTTDEGKVLLRELRIRKAVFEPQFTGPDRIMFTRDQRKG